jgi:hypothetical protein
LTPREEIRSEIDPLWSIETRRQNVDVSKGCDEEVMLEADLSIFIKPQQYEQIFVCSTVGIYTMEKVFPLSFLVTTNKKVHCKEKTPYKKGRWTRGRQTEIN